MSESNTKNDHQLEFLLSNSFNVHRHLVAVYDGASGTSLTYSQLEIVVRARAQQIIKHVVALSLQQNTKSETRRPFIGLMYKNSVELVISILGCISRRIPFLVLDPEWPTERLAFMVQSCGLEFCATDIKNEDDQYISISILIPGVQIIHNNEINTFGQNDHGDLFESWTIPLDLAYVNFTSGSTGKPKGIKHTWQEINVNILWNLQNFKEQLTTTRCKKNFLQLIPYFSDPSIRQLLLPLVTGGCITTLGTGSSKNAGNIQEWVTLMTSKGVTDVVIVPNLLYGFLDYIECHDGNAQSLQLERVYSVGEPLPIMTAKRLLNLFPTVNLYNQYGVSEISGNLTNYLYNSLTINIDSLSKYVPVGNLGPHVKYHFVEYDNNGKISICDDAQSTKKSKAGILAVHVQGMCYNYIGKSYEEKFVHLGSKSANYFVTGDLFRTCAEDGALVFEGRLDHQVKILGHRVELLEIEAVLNLLDNMSSIVILKENGKRMLPILVAYYTQALNNTLNVKNNSKLRKHMSKYLPSYMIPQRFLQLKEFPKLPNGKVDRLLLQNAPLESFEQEQDQGIATDHFSIFQLAVRETYNAVFRFGIEDVHLSLESNFFELGGNSLLVYQILNLLMEKLNIKLCAADVFNNPTIRSLASVAEAKTHANLINIKIEDSDQVSYDHSLKFPLEPLQVAYIYATADDHIPIHDYLELYCKTLNIQTLQKSLNQLVNRHEMLRCIVVLDGEGLQQVLNSMSEYEIQIYDMQSSRHKELSLETHLSQVRMQMSHQIFDPAKFPCFDIRITRIQGHDYLHLSFSGLFIDAKSFEIILKDWSLLYRGEVPLLPLRYAFKEYITHKSVSAKANFDFYNLDKKYWLNRAAKFPSGPDLPIKSISMPMTSQSQVQSSRIFARCTDNIPREAWQNIIKLSTENGNKFSSNSILLATFADVIANFCTSKHFGLNITLDTRTPINSDVAGIVGNFTSLNILECSLDHCEGNANNSFYETLFQTQTQLLSDLDHRLYTGIDLQRHFASSSFSSSLDHSVVQYQFPVVFTSLLELDRNFANLFNGEYELTSFHITQTPKVWIDCKVYENSEHELIIEWDYLDGIFPHGLVQTMHNLYVRNVIVISKYGLNIERSHLRPNKVLEGILELDNKSEIEMYCLHELFFRKLAEPTMGSDNVLAIIAKGCNISYAQLGRLVFAFCKQLAKYILSSDQFVGVMLEKGPLQVIATLAVLSLGLAYVPIDPQWPRNRLQSIISQCRINCCIVTESCKELASTLTKSVCCVENSTNCNSDYDLPTLPNDVDTLAYVIFTSGTTGIPKGVAMTHRAAVNTILDMNRRCNINKFDRVFAISELHFDLSVYDIFGTLAAGGCIVFPDSDDAKLEPSSWIHLIQAHCVTLWNSVPAYLQMLTNFVQIKGNGEKFQGLESLRWVWLSGDRIPLVLPDKIKSFAKSCQVLSLGGATEAGIWSIYYHVKEIDPEWDTIPYGRSLTNQRVYVLDSHLEHCPVWVKGELYIAGAGLALGYWNDQEKTDAAFFLHPKTRERLYRTGDYGRYTPDGTIEFLGRLDEQVKVHGHRIELGEIRTALLNHYIVTDAHVMLRSSNDNNKGKSQICAFITTNDLQVEFGSKKSTSSQDIESLYKFKKSQPGLRPSTETFLQNQSCTILLEPRTQNTFEFFRRKSYRTFESKFKNEPRAVLSNLLNDCFSTLCTTRNETNECMSINLKAVGHFLAPLAQLRQEFDSELPKYSYASTGSLYPIQVYLEIGPCTIDGITPGFYYYNPVQHQIQAVNLSIDYTITISPKLKIFLVGKYSALRPIYGPISESLMWLNAGYLLSALLQTQDIVKPWNWELQRESCPDLILKLGCPEIDESKPLISLSWNTLAKNEITQNFKSTMLLSRVNVISCIKSSGARKLEIWFKYDVDELSKTIGFPENLSFDGDSALIFGESTVGIFLTSSSTKPSVEVEFNLLASGFLGHLLMTKALKYGIGLCPIGGLDGNMLSVETNLTHALFGGYVSEAQLKSEQPSSMKTINDQISMSACVIDFLKTQLPNYMNPDGVKALQAWPLTANGKIDTKALQMTWENLEYKKIAQENNDNFVVLNSFDEISEFLLTIVKNILQLETTCNLSDNFFRLGGNSLSAVQLAGRLRKRFRTEVTVRDVLKNPDLFKLYDLLKTNTMCNSSISSLGITLAKDIQNIPLTSSQKRLFFLHQLNPNGCEYNEVNVVNLKGRININALSYAFKQLTCRQTALRTRFYMNTSGEPIQEICTLNTNENFIQEIEISSENELADRLKAEICKPFDLSVAPIFRIGLFHNRSDAHTKESVLVLVQHHIITDGGSMRIISEELSRAYNAYNAKVNGEQTFAHELEIKFHDFALWESMQLSKDKIEGSLQYWKNTLIGDGQGGVLPILQMPTQCPRPREFTYNGKCYTFEFGPKLSSKCNEVAISLDTTLFSVLLALTSALLARYSGQNEICIGTPVSSRFIPELENVAGFLVNTVVHKICAFDRNLELSFTKLLKMVSDAVFNSLYHQHCPLEHLLGDLGPNLERDPSRNPLFQVMVALEDKKSGFNLQFDGLQVSEFEIKTGKTKFDFSFVYKYDKESGNVSCRLEYYSDIYSDEFIQDMCTNFIHFTSQLVYNLGSPLNQISVTCPKAVQEILKLINEIQHFSMNNFTIPELFKFATEKYKNNVAIQFDSQSLTYSQLDKLTDLIGLNLRNNLSNSQSQFLDQGQIIPIFSTNKYNTILLILGVLKSGNAFVSLDSRLPTSRLEYICDDIKAQFLLSDRDDHNASHSKSHDILKIISAHKITLSLKDLLKSPLQVSKYLQPLNRNCDANDCAAVVYTSGTTGNPKGVLIPHRSFTRLILDTSWIQIKHTDVVSQTTTLSFDISYFEIFAALLSGAKLLVISKDMFLEPQLFYESVLKEGVSVMFVGPSTFNTMMQVYPEIFTNLRILLFGGEELKVTSVQKLLDGPHHPEFVINAYGPTENGIITTTQIITQDVLRSGVIPIGKPIAGSSCFVLDKWLNPVPKFVTGECYIGGCGLALGYKNLESETRRVFVEEGQIFKFIAHDSGKNSTVLYKTGDLVSITSDGSLCFHGREDGQVKLRGHRVELAEIQKLLLKMSDILVDAAVIICKDDVKQCSTLVAFVVVVRQTITEAEIFKRATHFLPNYMMPAHILILPEIPLTLNGKADLKKLSTQFLLLQCKTNSLELLKTNILVEKLNDTETKLLELWRKYLNIQFISRNDNFFQIGGDSLLAITVLYKINALFGISIKMKEFFAVPCIAGLSSFIHNQVPSSFLLLQEQILKPDIVNLHEPFPLLDMQLAYLVGRQLSYPVGKVSAHCYFEVECETLDLSLLNLALNAVIKRHDMLRCVVTSDYHQNILPTTTVPDYILESTVCNTEEEYQAAIKSRRVEMSHEILDLEHFPTFHIHVTHGVHVDTLHCSFDGMFMDAHSLQIFFNDWSHFYINQGSDTLFELPALNISFRDYVTFKNDETKSESHEKAKNYFLGRVSSFPSGPQLPFMIFSRTTAFESPKCLSLKEIIPAGIWSQIKEFGVRESLSPTTILLTIFSEIIAKFSTSKHFGIITTVFNRPPIHEQINSIIGEFTSINVLEINNLVVIPKFLEKIRTLQNRLYEDLEHRSFPPLEFQRQLSKKFGIHLEGMFPIVFTSLLGVKRVNWSNLFGKRFLRSGFWVTQTPQVFIDFKVFQDEGAALGVECDYLDGIFPEGLVPKMFDIFVECVSNISGYDGTEFELKPDMLLPKEDSFLLENLKIECLLKDTPICCLHELFFAQIKSRGNKPAIVTKNRVITYIQLANMTQTVAQVLQNNYNVKRGEFIAILLEKGWRQIVASLAIMSIGAAYVPIDTYLPAPRVLAILDTCQVTKVFTNMPTTISKLENGCEELNIDLILDHEPLESVHDYNDNNDSCTCTDPNTIAYVIFTSGSTGLPKGVAVTHGAAVNTILDMNCRCTINEMDTILGLSELHFDLSVYDIFGILSVGGCLALPEPEDKKEPEAWVKLICRARVTIWNSVPTLLQMVCDYFSAGTNLVGLDMDALDSLRWVWLSGDRIPLVLPDKIKSFAKSCQVLSLGGATEAGIWSIYYHVKEIDPEWDTIPYGRSLTNQRVYVLDSHLEHCPVWVKGELYIAGAGLALGYWNDQEKTDAAFFLHPKTRERLYRTGDYGRYTPDGNIEFLGRLDEQIKLDGHRIELGDIRAAILSHYLVTDAHVMLMGPGTQICGFVTSQKACDAEGLDNHNHIQSLYELKKSQPGLRSEPFAGNNENEIVLVPRVQVCEKYFTRKSYRTFESDQQPTLSVLSDLLNGCAVAVRSKIESNVSVHAKAKSIDLESLGHLLSPLSQLRRKTESKLPKYTYASAGSLYPIQVYIEIGLNAIQGVKPGYYYYDPVQHRLQFVNTSDASQTHSNVNLLLVGKDSVLKSLYGPTSDSLMWLNAGYLLSALALAQVEEEVAALWNWETISLEVPENKNSSNSSDLMSKLGLQACEHNFLLSLSWNLPGATIDNILLSNRINVITCSKPAGARKGQNWFSLSICDKGDGSRDCKLTKLQNTLENLSFHEESAQMFGEATVAFFLTPKSKAAVDLLTCGFWGHLLMREAIVKHGIGLYPIGGLEFRRIGPQPTAASHALFGGYVSTTQIESETLSTSSIKNLNGEMLTSAITRYIETQLPNYMIPEIVLVQGSLPLNRNNKIDRKALEALWLQLGSASAQINAKNGTRDQRVTPFDVYECDLMTLWSKVLQNSVIPLNTDFFRVGGNSLSALSLALLINEKFQIHVNVAWVFKYRTITQQAKEIEKQKYYNSVDIIKREAYIMFNESGTQWPIILVHPGRDSAFAYATLAKELGDQQPILVLEYYNLFQDTKLNIDERLETISARYVETLLSITNVQVVLQPPYNLGGWSFGGLVAFEMAKQLSSAGFLVSRVFMFDTPFPNTATMSCIPLETTESDLNIFNIISEPELQLYMSLSESAKEKYRRAAFIELKAMSSYKLDLHCTEFVKRLQIIQFLPAASELSHYESWKSFCSSLTIIPIPNADHSSILRNARHRAILVTQLKKFTFPKIIFVLIGSSFSCRRNFSTSGALSGHNLHALVYEENFVDFNKNYGNQFCTMLRIQKEKCIGHLKELDFDECRSHIQEIISQSDNNSTNVYIMSTDEGNVSVAAKLRNYFSLTSTGPSFEQSLKFRDKIIMKRTLAGAGIKVPIFVNFFTEDDTPLYNSLVSELGLPFVIKPINSGGGFNVYKVQNVQDFTKILSKLDTSVEYQAEEFLAGELYHCDIGLSHFELKPVFAEVCLYFQSFMGHECQHEFIGSTSIVSPHIRVEIIEFCTRAVQVLGGDCGLFHCEVFRDKSTEQLTFLEVGARVPGALIPKMYEMTSIGGSGVDLQEMNIRLQTHEYFPSDNILHPLNPKYGLWVLYFRHKPGNVMGINELSEQDFKNSKLIKIQTYYSPGDFYEPSKSMYNVVATLLFASIDFDEVTRLGEIVHNFRPLQFSAN